MQLPRWQYDQLLALQQHRSSPGAVRYEAGMDIISVSGYLVITGDTVVAFGDNARLIAEQNCTTIPFHRIIEIKTEAELIMVQDPDEG